MRTSLRELAWVFLKLGATAFGGPAAHIAMLEDETVRRRNWLSHEQFMDLLGATNLIPGPNSTEMCIHIGHLRRGFPGLLVAGTCFILPAAILVTLIAAAYVRFGQLPAASALMYGIKPVIIAVILQALIRLYPSAVKTRFLLAIALAAAILDLLGLNQLLILFASALAVPLVRQWNSLRQAHKSHSLPLLLIPPALPTFSTAAAIAAPLALGPIFLVFLKIGSVLYGSGYVLIAFLRADLVEHRHWLTEPQLIDAVAVGQFTPGPVFTTATFIGYLLAGPSGAAVATLGIFLPAFVFVALSSPFIPRLRKSPFFSHLLDGLNVASLALMATVTLHLAHSALLDPFTILLAAASTVLLLKYKLNSTWLILSGALLGLIFKCFP